MTEQTNTPENVWNDLKKANDSLLEKGDITLVGGPADGQTFQIPAGVNVLDVEVEGVTAKYLRSARDESTFQVYSG